MSLPKDLRTQLYLVYLDRGSRPYPHCPVCNRAVAFKDVAGYTLGVVPLRISTRVVGAVICGKCVSKFKQSRIFKRALQRMAEYPKRYAIDLAWVDPPDKPWKRLDRLWFSAHPDRTAYVRPQLLNEFPNPPKDPKDPDSPPSLVAVKRLDTSRPDPSGRYPLPPGIAILDGPDAPRRVYTIPLDADEEQSLLLWELARARFETFSDAPLAGVEHIAKRLAELWHPTPVQ